MRRAESTFSRVQVDSVRRRPLWLWSWLWEDVHVHVCHRLTRISAILHPNFVAGRIVVAADHPLDVAHAAPEVAALIDRQVAQVGHAAPRHDEHVARAEWLQVDRGDTQLRREEQL